MSNLRIRLCHGALSAAIAASSVASTANAQTITGRVVAKNGGAPVPGAIVALLDSAGRAVSTALAADSGTFALDAPSEGRYAIRVERVGFRSTTTPPFAVRQGRTTDVPIAIASEGISLRAIMVNADRRCVVRPREGLAAAQLWDEARKALSATELTQLAQAAARSRRDPHRFTVRVRRFTRELDPQALRTRSEEQYEVEGETVTPFVPAAPESLATAGYMVGSVQRGSTFFAPDASILLSDLFLDTHCFRVQPPASDRREDLVGLAFEPARLTSTFARNPAYVDVSGVLWLDRGTAELRYMDYGYVGLPFDAPEGAIGGRLEFRPLPDGRWIVWRWYIRTPRFEWRQKAVDPAMIGRLQSSLELVGIREGGAEVLEVMAPGTRSRRTAMLHGTVMDSLRGSPVAGARVFVSGTTFATVTDDDGSYTMGAIPPGHYTVSVVMPRIDSLLLDPPAHELSLNAGQELRVDFAIPSLKTFSERTCPDVDATDSLAIVLGVVRDTSDLSGTGATVRVEWNEFSKSASQIATHPIVVETRATRGGRYAVCGVPADRPITVRASRAGNRVAVPGLHLRAGEVRRMDLSLRVP